MCSLLGKPAWSFSTHNWAKPGGITGATTSLVLSDLELHRQALSEAASRNRRVCFLVLCRFGIHVVFWGLGLGVEMVWGLGS